MGTEKEMGKREAFDELRQLDYLNNQLSEISVGIKALSIDNERLRNLEAPLSILKADPTVYKQALSALTPEEFINLRRITHMEYGDYNTPTSWLETIFKPEQIGDVDAFINNVQALIDNNNQTAETLIRTYDELNIKLKELSNINPLELIPFGKIRDLERLFASSANSMIKIITQVMIKSMKETNRPKRLSRRGDIDMRRTVDKSMAYAGTPYELAFTSKAIKRRQVKPKIYLVVDVSGSQSAGIYLSVCIVYAFLNVMKDYDIVVYTAWDNYFRGYSKFIEQAEKVDLTNQRVARNDMCRRFNMETLLANASNPAKMFSLIEHDTGGGQHNTFAVVKALYSSITPGSIIITLGDNHQMYSSRQVNSEFTATERTLMGRNLKGGKVFSFNTIEYFEDDTTNSRQFDFEPTLPTNFSADDVFLYPQTTQASYRTRNPAKQHRRADSPKTYADMINMLLKSVSNATA